MYAVWQGQKSGRDPLELELQAAVILLCGYWEHNSGTLHKLAVLLIAKCVSSLLLPRVVVLGLPAHNVTERAVIRAPRADR